MECILHCLNQNSHQNMSNFVRSSHVELNPESNPYQVLQNVTRFE